MHLRGTPQEMGGRLHKPLRTLGWVSRGWEEAPGSPPPAGSDNTLLTYWGLSLPPLCPPEDPSPAQGRPPRMPGAIREGRPTLQPDTRSRPGRSSSFSSLGLLFHVTTCPRWGEIRLHVAPRLPCPQHSPNAGDTQKESLPEPTNTTARSSGLPEEKRKAEPPLSWGQGPCGIPGLPS